MHRADCQTTVMSPLEYSFLIFLGSIQLSFLEAIYGLFQGKQITKFPVFLPESAKSKASLICSSEYVLSINGSNSFFSKSPEVSFIEASISNGNGNFTFLFEK